MLKKEGVKIGSFFVIKISFSGITTFSAKISVYKLKESGSCIKKAMGRHDEQKVKVSKI